LDVGGVVYLAPEGVLSPDGRLGRLREAFDYLVENAHVPPRILPLGIGYDFMTTLTIRPCSS
jgi:1-acyl-sn-glycerol-3-phosphate acyltransferase